MRAWFYGQQNKIASTGLLVLRLVMGTAFLMHGWPKIQNPMGWMGPAAPVPGVLQSLAALAEFGGGVALILGFLTPLACLGIAANMITALSIVHLPHGDPFVGKAGQISYEPAAFYLASAVALLLVGPGQWSVDYLLLRKWRSQTTAAVRIGGPRRVPAI